MTDAQKAIQEYLARGGKITKVPAKNFHRNDYEAPVLKNRRILSDLVDRAKKASDA